MTSDNENQNLPDTPPGKKVTLRCPRLGHQIDFAYCQRENYGLPCFKTVDCWHAHFNVYKFLKEKLSPQDFENTFIKSAKPKILSLMELIEQAKKNKGMQD